MINHLLPDTTPVRLAVVVAFGLVVHAAGSFMTESASGVSPFFDTWLYNGLLLAVVVLAASSAGARRQRVGWILLAVGVLSWALGDVYWSAVVRHLDPEPYPTLADAAWLAFYPLTYLGLALIARRELPRMRAGEWLDGLIVGAGTAALAVVFVLPPVLRASEGSVAAVVTNAAYPIGDIALLSVVLATMSWFAWRPARHWWFLAGGAATFVVVDTLYLVHVANGTYVEGTASDTLWPLALFLIALAGLVQTPARRAAGSSRVGVGAPVLATAAAFGLLVGDRAVDVSLVATVLAGVTVVLAAARSLLFIRVLRSIGETRHQARTDDLTGLGNRRLLYQTLDQRFGSRRAEDAVCLLLLDLDRFKEINDSLGHRAGDRLLQAIGPRLHAAVRGGDVVVRLGGDEFAVVLIGSIPVDEAMSVAHRIRHLVAAPFDLEGITVRIDASIGVAVAPDHGDDASTLLQHADVAMYEAKSTKSGVALYAPGRDRGSRDRLEQIEALRAAILEGTLDVHFQPICDIGSGTPVSMEALVRWTRRDGESVPPDTFVPMAESLGLISMLTDHVLDRALAGHRTWRRAGFEVPVSVNLSPADLMDERLPARVATALRRAHVSGEALIVEITENTLMTDPSRARATIERLRETGVRIAIDDFGTGYSSLSYLRDLPVDELKLDRSFVGELSTDRHNNTITASAVSLAHALGLRFVAEGVETVAVREELRRMGADAAQGWHFARPMKMVDATAWLVSQFAAPQAPPIVTTAPRSELAPGAISPVAAG